MPFYEFRCQECHKGTRLFYTYQQYESAEPACRHCGSTHVRRKIGRIALAKGEDSRMESMMDNFDMGALENEDPRELGRLMRKMSSEMGEELGDDFGEVVDRLEKGQSPEDIEKALPELADGDAPSGMGGMGGMGGFDDF